MARAMMMNWVGLQCRTLVSLRNNVYTGRQYGFMGLSSIGECSVFGFAVLAASFALLRKQLYPPIILLATGIFLNPNRPQVYSLCCVNIRPVQ
jgi:hypothetical protein